MAFVSILSRVLTHLSSLKGFLRMESFCWYNLKVSIRLVYLSYSVTIISIIQQHTFLSFSSLTNFSLSQSSASHTSFFYLVWITSVAHYIINYLISHSFQKHHYYLKLFPFSNTRKCFKYVLLVCWPRRLWSLADCFCQGRCQWQRHSAACGTARSPTQRRRSFSNRSPESNVSTLGWRKCQY